MLPALVLSLYLLPRVGNADGAAGQVHGSKKPSHRVLREGMFALTKIDSARIVMLGDSLTEAAQWSEITGCHFVANRGIGGDVSAGVLRRLDEVIKLKPAAVFLMIGVNDVASNILTETIVDNVRHTTQRLTKAGVQVYLTLVLPVAQSYQHQINGKVDELNAAYIKLGEHANVSLVDFRDSMRTEDGFLRDELTTDGIHLRPDGYRVWRDAVTPLVVRHCQPVRSASGTSTKPEKVNDVEPTGHPSSEFNARFGPWR